MSDKPSFFAELKRRNVARMGGLYLVGAWLLTQVASTVLPTFDVPGWVLRGLIIALALGFLPALIFSWVFELTPQGLKRDEDVPPEQSIAPQIARRMDRMIIVVLLLALGYFAVDKFVLAPRRATLSGSKEGEASNSAKSVAVLPFENLSSDKENAYFAEGIQDEIITRLAKVAALKVISRTSTAHYASSPQNLPEIARQLGVANLLEGSVQKAGNAVHINVQLIRAASDDHLWAESYNRKLDDIFAVEGEVAGAIAEQLNAKLSGTEQVALNEIPTQNPAAYDAYRRGISIENTRFDDNAVHDAIAAYSEASQLDSKFVLPWARISILRSFLYFNGLDPIEGTAAAVKGAADRAFALEPDSGGAWMAQGAYRYRVLGDYEQALLAFEEARKRMPNNPLVLQLMGHVERRLGRWDAAGEHYRQAMERDPRNIALLNLVAWQYFGILRRFDEAQALFDRALEVNPDDAETFALRATIFRAEGRLDDADKALATADKIVEQAQGERDFTLYIQSKAQQNLYRRRFEAGITLLQPFFRQVQRPEDGRIDYLVDLGYCQVFAGKQSGAQTTFRRVVDLWKQLGDSSEGVGALSKTSYLALAYAGLNDKDRALACATRAVANNEKDHSNRPFTEMVLAQIQVRFGDFEPAIAAIPHLLEVPDGITVANLRFDPLWDPLRRDARFQKLCEEKLK